MRLWLPSAQPTRTALTPDLLMLSKLTPEAPALIDRAMSGVASHLPNNPVMVEAYSAGGTPEQEYVSSEGRAEAVRQYLESRFQLNSKWVGVMAFEDRPPEHTGKTSWDGISVVVIRSR
jgi:hypothetical protein